MCRVGVLMFRSKPFLVFLGAGMLFGYTMHYQRTSDLTSPVRPAPGRPPTSARSARSNAVYHRTVLTDRT